MPVLERYFSTFLACRRKKINSLVLHDRKLLLSLIALVKLEEKLSGSDNE